MTCIQVSVSPVGSTTKTCRKSCFSSPLCYGLQPDHHHLSPKEVMGPPDTAGSTHHSLSDPSRCINHISPAPSSSAHGAPSLLVPYCGHRLCVARSLLPPCVLSSSQLLVPRTPTLAFCSPSASPSFPAAFARAAALLQTLCPEHP